MVSQLVSRMVNQIAIQMAGTEPHASLACPRDGAALTVLCHDEEVPCHGCDVCRGVLLPFALIDELAAPTQALAHKAATWPCADLRCPKCGQPMRQTHHDGVEIDLCPACRVVWLDHGEIEAIRPPRLRDAVTAEAKEEAKDEAGYQAGKAVADKLLGKDTGLIDWLGDALGAILS